MYEIPEIQGWMNDDELQWLYEKALEMKSVVEIGSWKGKSTHALLCGCEGPVFAIDHFHGSPDELVNTHKEATIRDIFQDFWSNVGDFKNLVVMRMDSVVASTFFSIKSVDMVFIDGCHMKEAVLNDLVAWRPKCKKLLCGHDFGMEGVMAALDILNMEVKKEANGIWSYNMKECL